MDLAKYVPEEINVHNLSQADFPRIAKDDKLIQKIRSAIKDVPTDQRLILGDSRKMDENGVGLILTSPPYWIVKKYDAVRGQLGLINDYEEFLCELDKVWKRCYDALIPGGRLVIVVGDVCLSRRKYGRHRVMPLHASIQEHCREIGYDNLAPIIWYKISNVNFEVSKRENKGPFLGKPYEPNAIVKNDIEYILFQRKPGRYRSPNRTKRVLSIISVEEHHKYFQQIWNIQGASTKHHPSPFPLELAERVVKMFSFVGDKVLDPFLGTSTTLLAAALWGRNGIGYEIDPKYINHSYKRLREDVRLLNANIQRKKQSRKQGSAAPTPLLLSEEIFDNDKHRLLVEREAL